jgi:hypothetical protein
MAYDFSQPSSQDLTTTSTPLTAVPLTLACWFYSTNVSNQGSLVGVERSSGGINGYFIRSANNQFMVLQNASNVQGGTISVNTWHHGAATYPSSGNITGYLDGTSVVTPALTVTSTSADRIAIGSRFNNASGAFMSGRIAEVGIWNVALDAAEIASLAKGMTCDKVRPQSLVFYAPLVRDLVDAKGGLTITNNNSATVANHPRVYA